MKQSLILGLLFISMVACSKNKSTESNSSKVKVQLIRNASMKIEYAGKTILTDPMFSPKQSFMSFVVPDQNLNPTVDMPFTTTEIMKDVDAVMVSHAHPDHFDPVAIQVIDKSLPLFYQTFDEKAIEGAGFTNAKAVNKSVNWEGIEIIRTGGVHGSEATTEALGQVSGFVLKAENYPTIYWIGDCLYDNEVKANVKKYNPEIIITHSGGAVFMGQHKILMDDNATIELAKDAPKTKIIAVHMESLDHCQSTRESLKSKMQEANISSEKILIPADGESIELYV